MFQPFREEHVQFRAMVRAFVEREIRPHTDQWEKDRLFPNEVFRNSRADRRISETGAEG
jgi:acyl-CoA dehydrogenase